MHVWKIVIKLRVNSCCSYLWRLTISPGICCGLEPESITRWLSASCFTAVDPSLASSSPVWQHGVVIRSQGNTILWKPHMANFQGVSMERRAGAYLAVGDTCQGKSLGLGWQGFVVPGTCWGSLVSCPLAKRVGEGWCHVGTVGMWCLVAFVAFLQSTDHAESIWRERALPGSVPSFASASRNNFFFFLDQVWADIKDVFTPLKGYYFKGQIMPRAGFYCSLYIFLLVTSWILFLLFYFPVFGFLQTSNCHENSQVAFAQMHAGELLNMNCLVDKWGSVAIFNYAVFCNVSPTSIHLMDSNYS